MSRTELLAIGAALVSVAIWANFLVTTGGVIGEGLGVAAMGLMRSVVSTLALLPVLWRIGLYPKGLQFWRFVIMVLGGAVSFAFLVPAGFAFAPASVSGVFAPGVMPLWAALLSWAFLGERISRLRLGGFGLIAIGVLGVGGFQAIATATGGEWIGYLLFSSGSFCFACYAAAQRGSGLSALEATALISVWSLPITLTAALVWGADYSQISGPALAWTALAQFASGVVAIVTYTYAVIHLGPSRGSAFIALTPAVVAVASIIFLGDEASAMTWLGVAVVSVGVLIASGVFERRRAARAAPAGGAPA